jgi:hypothetical protein
VGSIFHDCDDTAWHIYQDRLNFLAPVGLSYGKMERRTHADMTNFCSLLPVSNENVKGKFNAAANSVGTRENVERKRLSLIATPSLPIRGSLSAP